jgi:hypothetical protein
MKRTLAFRSLALLLTLAFVGTSIPVAAQSAASPAPGGSGDSGFSAEQLEQLVAPIALYPDSLLTQMLMAATYPLEVVQADRFMRENADLTGDALDAALKEQDWDASVKGLCTLPDVLQQMSDNLDWAQDLGDAFLGQEEELLDTVQSMRGKANDAGNLQTTEQQVVTVQQDRIIVIESPQPEIIYVPTYSPTVVYGPSWHYPSYYYPRFYAPPPPGYGLITFGVGVAVGAAIWGNCRWGWGRTSVNINVNRYNSFNRNTNINFNRTNLSGNSARWQHNASHRRGVNYRSSSVANTYGGRGGSNRVSRDQARGRSTASKGTRQVHTPTAGAKSRTAGAKSRTAGAQAPKAGASSRAGAGQGTTARGKASSAGQGAAAQNRASGKKSQGGGAAKRPPASTAGRSSAASKSSAFSGSSQPSADRAASSRGSKSRGTKSYGGHSGSKGGKARSGGGGRRK